MLLIRRPGTGYALGPLSHQSATINRMRNARVEVAIFGTASSPHPRKLPGHFPLESYGSRRLDCVAYWVALSI